MERLPKKIKSLKRKFLRFFPKGFSDAKYLEWERNYKWQAHERWEVLLNEKEFKSLLLSKQYEEIAKRAVNIETKTNLLFSFEKMALRDAVKSYKGAKLFAEGLYDYIYGKEPMQERFERFANVLSQLPRKQTRVRTWPLLTVFGFIAKPKEFIFLKPQITKAAAKKYGFNFLYESKPNWNTYHSIIKFAKQIKREIIELHPKDMIDLQSFIWVMGSDEYS